MVYESQHPLVKHKLAILRDVTTNPIQFRALVGEIAQFLCYEACADLPLHLTEVDTPMGKAEGHELLPKVGLVPILRAGLGMVEPIWTMIPNAVIWHIGMYRNEETLEPVYYYDKFGEHDVNIDVAFLLDPMLATGGSAIAGVDRLKQWGVKQVRYIGLLAAPEGVDALQKAHPDVPIYVGAIDSHLNGIGYIVPGLGDAGDRQFGTL
ncbi:MAG: uracil phosphoribosyltransferase [Candidatus Promineifilaceae bacterium]